MLPSPDRDRPRRTLEMDRPSQPMSAGGSEMAVDSRGLVYNPRKEYVENGRFYHAWHKGKYLFPCDEVRPSAPIPHTRLLRRCRCKRRKRTGLTSCIKHSLSLAGISTSPHPCASVPATDATYWTSVAAQAFGQLTSLSSYPPHSSLWTSRILNNHHPVNTILNKSMFAAWILP